MVSGSVMLRIKVFFVLFVMFSLVDNAFCGKRDAKLNLISKYIKSHMDFPKKGINFRDISPLLAQPKAFQALISVFKGRYKKMKIDVICGVESRGFIVGAPLALELGIPFVMIRKPGKLPGKVTSVDYEKEYGKDSLSVQVDSIKPGQKVLIIDDLLATGGTMRGGEKLIEKLGAKVVEHAFIIELKDLKGREKLEAPVYSVLKY